MSEQTGELPSNLKGILKIYTTQGRNRNKTVRLVQ